MDSTTPHIAEDVEQRPALIAAETRLFYSEEETAVLLGIHRTTLRSLAISGHAPVAPVQITDHKRIYRRIDVERLAGIIE